jgi:hypothetical protein
MRNSLSFIIVLICIGSLFSSCTKTQDTKTQTVDFELLLIPSSGYWNGSDGTGFFLASDLKFENQYNSAWKSWSGFSYSQKNDVTSSGFENEFSVVDPANQKNKFAVFYPSFGGDTFVSLSGTGEYEPQSVDLCNSTYTALSLKNGNSFCKKFGGNTGTDPDWFKVTISGYNRSDIKVSSLDIYLADYRFTDPSKDFILSKWTTFDLKSLGKVNKITFTFSSSDTGAYGVNTPTYVCLDNIKYINNQVIL